MRALQKLGKKARLLFSWDEYDRLRKVPSNIAKITEGFDKYLGMPYAEIPDPHGVYSSYAEYNEKEFEKSLEELDIHPDYRYQAKLYTSNAYAEGIVFALEKRKEIYDVLLKYKTQEENGHNDIQCLGHHDPQHNPQIGSAVDFCRLRILFGNTAESSKQHQKVNI